VLWRTFEEGKPLLERDFRWWPGIVDVADVDELGDQHWEKIKSTLGTLLDELDALFNRGKRFDGLPVDDFFVRKLASVVASNYRIYSRLIRDRCDSSRKYYAELRKWTSEHGWSTLLRPEFTKTDPRAFEVLGRLAVFLLMDRVIFYNMVRTHHRSLPAMSIGGVRSGREFERRLRKYFDAVLAIDFATVFETDVFDQLLIPDDSTAQLERFVVDLNSYDFSTLSYEILGRVYETLIPEKERHALGQYFTPPTTVDLINAFCIRQADDIVLDPACGAGTFLVRAHARLNRLRPRAHRALIEQLWGIEIAKFPAHISTINLVLPDLAEKENFPYIIQDDVFKVKPVGAEVKVPARRHLRFRTRSIKGSHGVMVEVPSFDAVVGNPPYIERRNLSADEKRRISRTIKEDWALKSFTQAADIFVYFFVHAGRFLKEGGRLGFITSNAWLDHKYGWDLQRFLLERFKIISIIESRVERSFSHAEINTAITIVERCSDANARDNNIIRFVSLREPLHHLLGPDTLAGGPALVDAIMETSVLSMTEQFRVYPVTQAEARTQCLDDNGSWIGGRWGAVYLRAPDVYFTLLKRGAGFLVPLRQVADGVLGTKTGCDAFFVRSRDDLAALGLEERFSKPAYWSPGDCRAFVLEPEDASDRLVLISQSKHHLRGTNAPKYVSWGERLSYHHRGECERRSRSLGRWYDLSQQVQCGRVAFGKTYNERHAVFWNPEECVLGARFASFSPREGVEEELLLAILNSSITALFIEIFGRASLGQGALDFAVYEAASIPIIDPRRLSEPIQKALREAYRNLIKRNPLPVEEEVASPEKVALDEIVFDVIKLSTDERQEVVRALLDMNRGRLAKADSIERIGALKLNSTTDEEVLDFAIKETIAEIGLRRFPEAFPVTGTQFRVHLPEGRSAEVPKVEALLTQGSLVWSDGSRVECPSLEAAQLAALLMALGLRGSVQVPAERKEAHRLYNDLHAYVAQCEKKFGEELEGAVEGGAQFKRVKQCFLEALGQAVLDIDHGKL